jgi:CRISPR-associated protein Csx17
MPDLRLSGCSPEPLQSYGKALGVFRLVAEQCDPDARAYWRGGTLTLRTELDEAELRRFFLDKYEPTPIISPWNLDSGFFGGRQGIARLEAHPEPRLHAYRESIRAARRVLSDYGLGAGLPKDEVKKRLAASKQQLIARLRAALPDVATRWIDATAVLTGGSVAYPPLFGAGGTDGRFELSGGFIGALLTILDAPDRKAPALEAALFGSPQPSMESLSPGLFAPGGVGGPNSLEGFEGGGGANPWEIVLAFEGLLLLAGSAARRFGAQTAVRAAFPFVVRTAVAAGYPTAADEEARGEVWLPIWRRPASLPEIRHVFREGRADWNGRPATSGIDVARSLVSLGVDRGLEEFRRFGIQQRNGRSFLATPLGRFRVTWRPEALVLAELDPFLERASSLRSSTQAPAALLRLVRRLDDAILAYCAEGDRERLLDVLIAVGQVDRALGTRASLRERLALQPVPMLSRRWVFASNDRTPEFSIAAAVASLQPSKEGWPGATRQYLAPVEPRGWGWRWAVDGTRSVVWTGRDVVADLVRLVDRRLLEAERTGEPSPFRGAWSARPGEVAAFLRGEVDLVRLARLVEGLSLVGWQATDVTHQHAGGQATDQGELPVTFALIKLTAVGDTELFARLGARGVPRLDPTIVRLLRAGQIWEAARRAARRLRAVGITPIAWERMASESRAVRPDLAAGRRLAAALAVPLDPLDMLVDLVLERASPVGSAEPVSA